MATVVAILVSGFVVVSVPQRAWAAPTLAVTVEPVDYLTGAPQTTASYGTHGDRLAYRVNYSCAAEPCTDVEVQLSPSQPDPYGLAAQAVLPTIASTLLTYESWTAPFTGASISGDDTSGKVVSLGDLTAGDAGSFLVVYKIEETGTYTTARAAQFYPSGFQIAMAATMAAANGTPVTGNAAAVTWNNEIPEPSFVKTNPGVVGPGEEVTYSLRMSSGSFPRRDSSAITGTSQWAAAGNFTVVDTLPPEAVYVASSDGGVYDPVAHTVTWSEGTLAEPSYFAAGGWGHTSATGWVGRNTYNPRSVTVTYPASSFPDADPSGCNFDSPVTNQVGATLNYLDADRTEKTASASVDHNVACYTPFGRATVRKGANRDTVVAGTDGVYVPPDVTGMDCPGSGFDQWGRPCTPGGPLTPFDSISRLWQVRSFNAGNVPGVVTISDPDLDYPGQPVWRIRTTTATTPQPTINWTYQCGTDTPVSGTTVTTAVSLTVPQQEAGCRYISATMVSGAVQPGNVRPTDTAVGTEFDAVFDYMLRPGAPVGITNTNTATATMTYPDQPIDDIPLGPVTKDVTLVPQPLADNVATLTAGFAGPAVVNGGGNAVPGRDVTFSVNGETLNIPADIDITPQYAFVAPAGWTIVPGSAAFAAGSVPPGVSFLYETKTIGGVAREVVTATWPDDVAFGANETWPTMTVIARPTFAVAAGTNSVANSWIADSRNNWDATSATFTAGTQDAPDIDGDTNVDEWFSVRSQTVLVSSADGLSVVKEICRANPDAADGCDWFSDPDVLVPVATTASSITYRITLQNTGNTTLDDVIAYDIMPWVGDVGISEGTAGVPRGSTFAVTVAGTSDVTPNLSIDFSSSTNPCRPEVYPGAPDCVDDWGPTGSQSIRAAVTGAMDPGDSASFTVTGAVVAGATADAQACNSVAIDSDGTLATEPQPVCATTQEADLRITVPDRLPLQLGRPGVVPFTVTNLGGSDNAPASVAIDIPADMTVNDLDPLGWTCAPLPAGTAPIVGPVMLTCTPVTGMGDARTLALDTPEPLGIAVTPTQGTTVCVPAAVAGQFHDPVLDNNTAESCMTLAPLEVPEIAVDKDDGLTTVAPGDEYTYTLTVQSRLTSETIGGVALTDTLPDNLTFVSASGGGTLGGENPDGTGGTVTWNLPDLQPAGVPTGTGSGTSGGAGSTQTVTVTVQVAQSATGTVDNQATVTAPDPGNPTNTLTDDDNDVDDIQNAAISLVKSADPTVVTTIGQEVNYTFEVTNTGNAALGDISIGDDLDGLSAIACADSTLDPTDTTTCTATYAATEGDFLAGEIVNTATAIGTPPIGDPITSASSTATVIAPQSAGLALLKTATEASFDAAGQTLHFSFEVTNTGNVGVDSLVVNDQLPGTSPVICAAATLGPAATTTCTADYVTTPADLDAGSVINTATATALAPGGPVTSDPSTVEVPAEVNATISVAKTAAETSFIDAGTTLHYNFLVTNTGNVTLTDIAVNDVLPGISEVTCPSDLLPAGATQTCTATYVTTLDDVNAESVDNSATVTGTPPSGQAVTSAPSTATVPAIQTPAISIVKSIAEDEMLEAGQILDYSFLVTNTGNVTLTDVSVTDVLPGISAVSCPDTELDPAESTTCTATYTLQQADIDNNDQLINTATATGQPPTGDPVASAPSSASIPPVLLPSLSIVKTAQQADFAATDTTLDFAFDVTNTGNVTLQNLIINDPLPGISTVTCAATQLAPHATTTCAATYVTTQADLDAGAVVNVATATATTPSGQPVTSPPDDVTVDAVQTADVTFVKDAVEDSYAAAGQIVNFTFEIANTGNVTLSQISVTDHLAGVSTVACPRSMVAPATSMTCTATYPVTQADLDSGAIHNEATLSATPPVGDPLERAAGVDVPADQRPSIGLTKSVTESGFDAAGTTLHYSFVVTNTGNVTLTGVAVDDPLGGLSALDCSGDQIGPDDTVTCTATYLTTQADLDAGHVANTAIATGQPPSGDPVTSAPSTATVPAIVNPALIVTKTADTATFTTGQTITYSFEVTNAGNVTVTDLVVTDPMDGLGAIDCPTTTLAPSAPTTCTASYTATQADFDAGTITNTANATGQLPSGAPVTTPSSTVAITATGVAPAITIVKTVAESEYAAGTTLHYGFAVTNTGNVTLTDLAIDDPLPGLSAVACPASTLAPSASMTCTATYTATQADVDAGAIDNTATATANGSGSTPLVSEPSTVQVAALAPVTPPTTPAPPTTVPPTPPPTGLLPSTGGSGIVHMMLTAGLVLLAGLAIAGITRRRQQPGAAG